MSYTVQQLLALAARFEKMAVDIPQSPDFDDDYTKYKEMLDPKPENDEDAYQKWLKDTGPLDEEIPVEEVDDLPFKEEGLPSEMKADTYIRTAAKEKLDPKAKVRNRGTVCVPAESAKDKKDHFPINDEGQARSALSRVEGLTSAPWYNGSLEGLRSLVKRKVHSKYPSIGKDKSSTKKKASLEAIDAMLYELDSEYVE